MKWKLWLGKTRDDQWVTRGNFLKEELKDLKHEMGSFNELENVRKIQNFAVNSRVIFKKASEPFKLYGFKF